MKVHHIVFRGANNAVEMIPDLFGSILLLAVKRKSYMEEVLSFPLTPSPLTLSHAGGTMLKTHSRKINYNPEYLVI